MQKPWQQVKEADSEIFNLIESELKRQKEGLEMIASENFASMAVIAAMGNICTNKYAEGLPAKRYYGGCSEVDKIEKIAIERACQVFGAKFANVQPHSGASANQAVFQAFLKPGDRILGLDLSHGGHLTHGSKVNFSGANYESHFYGLDPESQRINMDAVRAKALEIKPKMIIAGASAYARQLDFASFRRIADEVGALLMVDMAHIAGLVAADLHPNPVPYADVVTTTTHKTLRGPRGGLILWNNEAHTAALNKGVFPGTQGGPLMHVIAAKAVCFKEALLPSFKAYQKEVILNAQSFASELMSLGFKLVSGGTDNHLVLLDLSNTPVSGKALEEALGAVEITVNKNTVPNETRSPFVTSGVRFGTPALTTRGFNAENMREIARIIKEVFTSLDQFPEMPISDRSTALAPLKTRVKLLANKYPLYPAWEG
ncbi:MAG: serine hydroxymethyltransferase [Pseudomonadota bacterium]